MNSNAERQQQSPTLVLSWVHQERARDRVATCLLGDANTNRRLRSFDAAKKNDITCPGFLPEACR